MASFGRDLLSKGLSREDERGADVHGAAFVERAGYGSRGLVRFLERLRRRESERSRGLTLFRTHPPAPVRLEALARARASTADKPLADRSVPPGTRFICRIPPASF